ncbi:hypothetical protein [Serratia fonticola]
MGMKSEGDTITCDCGFSFQRGQSGKHECADGLRAKLAAAVRREESLKASVDVLGRRIAELEQHREQNLSIKTNLVNTIKEMRAATEAMPVGSFHISDQQVEATTDYVKDGEWPIDNGELLVYTAPPAPAVPDDITGIIKRFQHQCDHLSDWHHIDEHSCKVDRRDLMTVTAFLGACLAAMLNGGKS